MPFNDHAIAEQKPESGEGSWQERREWLRARVSQQSVLDISPEEIEAHFAGMPADYWESVTEADVIWSLETIHGFLTLISSPRISPTTPFVNWHQSASTGSQADGAARHPCPTRVLLCTWDRRGLLAKAAAAFSAVRINILQAQVFTRADNIVLDDFCVADADGQITVSDARLEQMRFLLEGALSEPPRFASVWACSRHKFLAQRSAIAPRITFDNESAADATIIRVEAADRLGLLYDVLQAISDEGLDVKQAQIGTEANLAHDIIYVIDPSKPSEPKVDAERLEVLHARLEAALTLTDASVPGQNGCRPMLLQTH